MLSLLYFLFLQYGIFCSFYSVTSFSGRFSIVHIFCLFLLRSYNCNIRQNFPKPSKLCDVPRMIFYVFLDTYLHLWHWHCQGNTDNQCCIFRPLRTFISAPSEEATSHSHPTSPSIFHFSKSSSRSYSQADKLNVWKPPNKETQISQS